MVQWWYNSLARGPVEVWAEFMRSIFGELKESLRRWWQADRIRVSASQGRLRRLKAGDRVLLDGRIWQVLSSGLESLPSQATIGQVMFRAVLQNVDESDLVAQATLEAAIPLGAGIEGINGTGVLVMASGERIPVSDGDLTLMTGAADDRSSCASTVRTP